MLFIIDIVAVIVNFLSHCISSKLFLSQPMIFVFFASNWKGGEGEWHVIFSGSTKLENTQFICWQKTVPMKRMRNMHFMRERSVGYIIRGPVPIQSSSVLRQIFSDVGYEVQVTGSWIFFSGLQITEKL